LPVDVVAQQGFVQLQHIGIVRKHDVAGIVEGKALVHDRAAPAADRGACCQQQAAFAQVVGGRQAGGASANHHGRIMHGPGLRGSNWRHRLVLQVRSNRGEYAMRVLVPVSGKARRQRLDLRLNSIGGGVPGSRRHDALHLRAPVAGVRLGFGQQSFTGLDEFSRRVGNRHHMAVGFDHVADAGADRGLASGHVFERLGRADETRGVVERKRQQADIPSGHEARQVVIALLAQPVNVAAPGQRVLANLDHRADHDELPLGMRIGQGGNQVQVDALVDHAAVAQPGMRQAGLRPVVACIVWRERRKVCSIDAARKAVHVAVALALGAVQAGAAGQHQVSHLVERVFTLDQLARRMQERRQLVHAVVDDGARRQPAGQWQRHGRVEPDQVVVNAALVDEVGQVALQHRQMVVVKAGHGAGHMRPQHFHVGRGRQVLDVVGAVRNRFFHEDDLVMLCQAREQVLWPLIDEVPAQV